jgi:hypothetical protein
VFPVVGVVDLNPLLLAVKPHDPKDVVCEAIPPLACKESAAS